MSRGGDTRFRKGQSGNPKGRPKQRRPHNSAFDIIFDKTLTVTQGGKERELTVDEALELQTYQAALGGSRMAIRKVLKMIEKREAVLAKRNPPPTRNIEMIHEHAATNEVEALKILGIIGPDPKWGDEQHKDMWQRVSTWATQAALSRPGRRRFSQRQVDDIGKFTLEPDKLRWPRGTKA